MPYLYLSPFLLVSTRETLATNEKNIPSSTFKSLLNHHHIFSNERKKTRQNVPSCHIKVMFDVCPLIKFSFKNKEKNVLGVNACGLECQYRDMQKKIYGKNDNLTSGLLFICFIIISEKFKFFLAGIVK